MPNKSPPIRTISPCSLKPTSILPQLRPQLSMLSRGLKLRGSRIRARGFPTTFAMHSYYISVRVPRFKVSPSASWVSV
eukprot:54650-Rhodomonas_salina.2